MPRAPKSPQAPSTKFGIKSEFVRVKPHMTVEDIMAAGNQTTQDGLSPPTTVEEGTPDLKVGGPPEPPDVRPH